MRKNLTGRIFAGLFASMGSLSGSDQIDFFRTHEKPKGKGWNKSGFKHSLRLANNVGRRNSVYRGK